MSRCLLAFLVPVIACCNLQPVTSDLIWCSTAVRSWLNFIMKTVTKAWEGTWAKAMYNNKRKNTDRTEIVEIVTAAQGLKIKTKNVWNTKEKAGTPKIAIWQEWGLAYSEKQWRPPFPSWLRLAGYQGHGIYPDSRVLLHDVEDDSTKATQWVRLWFLNVRCWSYIPILIAGW